MIKPTREDFGRAVEIIVPPLLAGAFDQVRGRLVWIGGQFVRVSFDGGRRGRRMHVRDLIWVAGKDRETDGGDHVTK